MSRPTSVASSKRSDKEIISSRTSKAPTWVGRSSREIFIHNLHLLDLDQLSDWPVITAESYGNKSTLQHRLRATEWALYRLFELYDAQIARSRLKPFFPGNTPSSSKNLRSALYRQLGELKKNGILSPSIQLRQTMLDECKGDKVEDMLAAVSTLVVQRKHSVHTAAIADIDAAHITPLVLMKRYALHTISSKRQSLAQSTDAQRTQLSRETKQLRADSAKLVQEGSAKLPANSERIKTIVRESWIGHHQWANALIQGNSGFLTQKLEARIMDHKTRLTDWQAYANELKNQPERHITPTHTVMETDTLGRFRRHTKNDQASNNPEVLKLLHPQHQVIVESLSTYLADHQGPTKEPARSQNNHQKDDLTSAKSCLLSPEESLSSFTATVDEEDAERRGLNQDRTKQTESTVNEPDTEIDMLLPSSMTPNMTRQNKRSNISVKRMSLADRTRSSMARLELSAQATSKSLHSVVENIGPETMNVEVSTPRSPIRDESTLLERTRQSMSMLTQKLEAQSASTTRSTTNRRISHGKSKSYSAYRTRPVLERAWSEEERSLEDDSFDADAAYDDVFKSRPKLAMSPDLSPKRNDESEVLLEFSMKKLRLDSGSY